MSTERLPNIDQLLALPLEQRGDIASALIRSIGDETAQASDVADWDVAIAARSNELASGNAQLIDTSESISEARTRIAIAKTS